ncbi:MAG: S8 family serine peptidase [Dysgonamonadaceae bacterium]|jgi:subtilisin family serine protease|nr:S8 family serine peptidase [Dysgonamonadaceae bacterium]
MKRICVFIVLIAISAGLFSQNGYYWHRENKIVLEELPTKKYVMVNSFEDTTKLKAVLNKQNIKINPFVATPVTGLNYLQKESPSTICWTTVEGEAIPDLTNEAFILYQAPYFLTGDKREAGLSNLFYLKLNKAEDFNILENMAKKNGVTILGNDKYMPLWYLLSCSKESRGNAMQMANLFYESRLFASSQPDLMANDILYCVNDTYFSNQWGLNNTGQSGGTAGIDINYCQARNITTGSSNVVIAVLDEGVIFNHPDLTNFSPYSYDTESDSSPSQVLGDHGTACAGIIGATANNNLGVAGIAPGCPIMSISNSLYSYPQARMDRARGFNFAYQNGAAVISNSWGSGERYQVIDDAINNALTYGRNGLGCVIVFASGNDNGAVSYPANSNDSIIVVGAMSPCAERKNPNSCDGEYWWGGNYGPKLDVVAPGVLIPTTTYTGGYMQNFNGTSSACPHVAAVAGLILSVNPALSQSEVASIIDRTARKVGNYSYQTTADHPNGTWNNEMGYGLVDAYAAVELASCIRNVHDQTITSNTMIMGCDINVWNVTVTNNAKLTLDSSGDTLIESNFEVQLGAELEIK